MAIRLTEADARPGATHAPGARLLTPDEAAQIIHVSTSTVLRWARDGSLPSIMVPSGRRRFRISDLPGFTDPSHRA